MKTLVLCLIALTVGVLNLIGAAIEWADEQAVKVFDWVQENL